jgi:hypothetical protein
MRGARGAQGASPAKGIVEENMSKITTRGLCSAASRNLKFVLVPALLACTSLTGCGSIMEALTQGKADGMVNADPIDFGAITVYKPQWAPPTNAAQKSGDSATPAPSVDSVPPAKVEYLGAIVRQSETNCLKFVSGLVLGENTINTTGDVSATLFSVLSTAVTPPGTKNVFSAASSIASGSKAAIDADIYDNAAIADFATAILGTYYTHIKDYSDKLSGLTDDQRNALIVNLEMGRILSIHAECGLAPAESSIRAKLGATKSETQKTKENQPENPPGGKQHQLNLIGTGQKQQGAGEQLPSTSGVVPGQAW